MFVLVPEITGNSRTGTIQCPAGRSRLATVLACGLLVTARAAIPTDYPTGPGPASVGYGPDGRLISVYDPNGDRIPDFSACGYGGGGVAIPTNIPIVATLDPIGGDNRPQIQAAINALSAQPPATNGFRGVILLKRGIYTFTGTLQINASGIVLRGEGDGTNGTILRRTDSNADAINVVNNPKTSRSKVSGTTHNITNSYVPVGATWFSLDSVTGLSVGDEIVVTRPQTWPWVDYMHMGTNGSGDWQSGDATVNWDRVITEIDGPRVRIDVPLMQAIEQQWTTGQVYKYTWPSRLLNVGVEDIRADAPGVNEDELGNTDGNFLTMTFVKNGWVRRCTNDKMRGHTVKVSSCKWVTVEDIVSYHNPLPAGHSGASIQIFTGDYADQVLYHRITASSGGFEFSAGRQCPGPIVYTESQVPAGFAFSGPHMQWNLGFLWDALEMHHNLACFYQSRGWTSGNHLAWNCESSANYAFERPPGTHLWIQGCQLPGALTPVRSFVAAYGGTPAEVLSPGTHLEPGSLYRAQLSERVGSQQALAVLGKPDGANHFVLNVASDAQTVPAGQTNSFVLRMTVEPGYPGSNVTFSATGLPLGADAGFNPPTLSTDGVVAVTVATSAATPVGTYHVRILGTGTFRKCSGGTQTLAHPVFIRVTVTNATDFSILAAPPAQTVLAGSNATFVVSLLATNTFTDSVSLSLSGRPPNASSDFNPPAITPGGTSVLTLITSNTTPDGNYTLTIAGTSGGQSGGATVNLNVLPPPGTLPPEWKDADVGIRTNAGYANFFNDTFTVKGSGAGIAGLNDQFNYLYQPWSGDVVITARVLSQTPSPAPARAGVMVRETTNANSRFVALFVTAGLGAVMQYRSVPGNNAVSTTTNGGVTAPYWVRLARYGDTLTGYRSADGTNWSEVGSIGVIMSDSVNVGLAVASYDTNKLNTALFDNVTLGTPDFSVAVSPLSLIVTGGFSANYTVSVVATNSFNGNVVLSAAGLPGECAAGFAPPSIVGTGTAILTVTTSNTTAADRYTLLIGGTSGFLGHSDTTILNVIAADTDGDGLPDPWMQRYFGHVTARADDRSRATDDADGDGMSNLAEYLAGTDPTDADSSLRLISTSREGDDLRVTWAAVAGKSYIVEAAGQLAVSNSFTDISPLIVVPDDAGSTFDFLEPGGGTSGASRYYRVRLVP